MENFWTIWGPIIIGTIIGIIVFRTTNNYNKNVIDEFKNKCVNINEYKTYKDIINIIGECNETNIENDNKIRSWIIRSENRILYKMSIKFDNNVNNLGVCFESTQLKKQSRNLEFSFRVIRRMKSIIITG